MKTAANTADAAIRLTITVLLTTDARLLQLTSLTSAMRTTKVTLRSANLGTSSHFARCSGFSFDLLPPSAAESSNPSDAPNAPRLSLEVDVISLQTSLSATLRMATLVLTLTVGTLASAQGYQYSELADFSLAHIFGGVTLNGAVYGAVGIAPGSYGYVFCNQ
jgi:hypothetical protein